jgi:cytochrome o ubiquinol oxidase subunit 3
MTMRCSGMAFVAIELYEFAHMFHRVGATPQRSAFLSSFYHAGRHARAARQLRHDLAVYGPDGADRTPRLDRGQQAAACCASSMFWHFLDMIWIGVFSFVYLLGVLR